MATSGSYDFNVTAAQIEKDALLLVGAIDPINDVSANDSAICRRFLNMIIKNLQKDANLWVTTEVSHTLTPGTESYTVGTGLDIDTARPLRLIQCYRVDADGVWIPVDVVSREDYKSQPVKSTQAPALMVYYDLQRANGVLYVWPTGSTDNTTIKLTFKRPIQDFDSNGNNPDLPDEWALALVHALATIISPIYTGATKADIAAVTSGLIAELKDHDTEQVPIQFKPQVGC